VRPRWQLGGGGDDGCLAAQAAAWWQWRVAVAWRRRQRGGGIGGSMAAAGCSLAQAARRWQLCRGSSATEQGWWWRWQQLGYGGGSLAAERLRQLGCSRRAFPISNDDEMLTAVSTVLLLRLLAHDFRPPRCRVSRRKGPMLNNTATQAISGGGETR
jgi:hypothetical protein